MSFTRFLSNLVKLLVCIFFITACSNTSPQQPSIQIISDEGTLTTDKIEILDRFPPDCTQGETNCSVTASGSKFLIIWFQKDGPDLAPLSHADVYITNARGQHLSRFASGVFNGQSFILFGYPEDSQGLVLVWPNNEPIDLDNILGIVPETPTPENTPMPPTGVRVTINDTGANIRSGPGTEYEPPIGGLAAGTTSDALAISSDGKWLMIRYFNGTGWVASGFVTVIDGNVESLPIQDQAQP